jgi:hypothetical protein
MSGLIPYAGQRGDGSEGADIFRSEMNATGSECRSTTLIVHRPARAGIASPCGERGRLGAPSYRLSLVPFRANASDGRSGPDDGRKRNRGGAGERDGVASKAGCARSERRSAVLHRRLASPNFESLVTILRGSACV